MGGLDQAAAGIRATVQRACESGARNLWLVQLGEGWLIDPTSANVADAATYAASCDARSECDALLLEALFNGRIERVRRAVLYDLSSDAGERLALAGADPIAVHGEVYSSLDAWKVRLRRHVAMFADYDANVSPDLLSTGRLAIREVILGRVTSNDTLDLAARDGRLDACAFGEDGEEPEAWTALTRAIWMEGSMDPPLEDADPLDAIPTLEVSDYHGRFAQ